MSKDRQVKINKNLHEEVKEFVNSESTYSSYKSFYEEAVRTHLRRNKEQLSEEQREAIEKVKEEMSKR